MAFSDGATAAGWEKQVWSQATVPGQSPAGPHGQVLSSQGALSVPEIGSAAAATDNPIGAAITAIASKTAKNLYMPVTMPTHPPI